MSRLEDKMPIPRILIMFPLRSLLVRLMVMPNGKAPAAHMTRERWHSAGKAWMKWVSINRFPTWSRMILESSDSVPGPENRFYVLRVLTIFLLESLLVRPNTKAEEYNALYVLSKCFKLP